MKPIWTKEMTLSVELHKVDEARLGKARAIGKMLDAMHQPEGLVLIDAVDDVLGNFSKVTEAEPDESDGAVKDGDK